MTMKYLPFTTTTTALALLIGLSTHALSAQADRRGPLRVGIATADITPEQPTWMRGFAARNRPSDGVARPLLCQVVVLDNGLTRVALVSLDVCAIGYRQLYRMRVAAEAAGVPQQHLMVNWSHAHFSPHLGGPEVHPGNVDYDALFLERTLPLFAAAVADLQPAVLDYTVGVSVMGVNRRKLDSHVDTDVPVLRVLGADGKIRAVLFGYACHPTTTAGQTMYLHGTDFPGYARDWIGGAYPGAEAIFLQGCGGDIKPAAIQPAAPGQRGRLNSPILLDERGIKMAMGHELGRAVCKALAVPPAPVPADRPEDIKQALEVPITLGGIVELVDIPSKANPERSMATPSHMGMWRLGDVYLFGSQHEVLSAIGLRIKRELPDVRIWTNGYTHWGGGYYADTAAFEVGGYEVDNTAFFAEAEDILVANVHRYLEHLQDTPVNPEPIPRCCP